MPLAGVMLVAAGCGESSSGQEPSAQSSGPEIPSVPAGPAADLVPEELKGRPLNIVTYNDYPPEMFVEDGELTGYNPELGLALAADLGLQPNLVGMNFDAIIPGVEAHRYDFAIAGLNITPERLEVVDLVAYINNSTGYATATNSDITVESGEDLCGLRAALLSGSAQHNEMTAQSEKCIAAGKQPIEVSTFTGASQANTAVISQRADVAVAQLTQLTYYASKSNGQLEVEPYRSGEGRQGLGVAKGDPLGPALVQALKDLIASGVYQDILKKWGVESLALSEPEMLPGPNQG
ncbi:ABC transporter substrate-binding protein [Mycolicibacterium sp.]|uniref:ABC transporter substrate-binding protein n=1 Tax=Mycolicibacterium sp. TaxID=2320850 RepID=UPI003D0FDB41